MISLKIDGHSTFDTFLFEESGSYFVRKQSRKIEDNIRLIKQFDKQSEFKSEFLSAITPIRHGMPDNKFFFDCEYINAYDFSEYMLVTPINDVIVTFNTILKYIEENCSSEKVEDCTYEVRTKYIKVKSEIIDLFGDIIDFKKCDRLFINNERMYLPTGYCHGDLTLSNMLFSRNSLKIYVFDFLDSYIDSPLIDIVKLRQDTKYKWSTHLLKIPPTDSTKLSILLNIFDEMIVRNFSNKSWYSDNYIRIQILNFLRMVKYSNNSTLPFIIHPIEELLCQV